MNTPVQIDKLIPGGQALGTLPDGKKAFFWNALPGETVEEYIITKKKSHYIEAIATKISNPSPHRIEPEDPCYLSTSPWQIMDFDYELEQKSALVAECFRQAGINLPKTAVYTDNHPFFYRNKMEYALYWNNEKGIIELAFHDRGSHRKTPISKSSLEHPEIFKKATEIVAELNEKHEEARKYQSLLLRSNASGEVSGGLFENGQPHPIFPNLTDTILGHEYSYSPNGFFQINLPVYESALTEIKKHITTDKVLDLYAGVGTIGLSVARDKELTLVECNKDAYRELERNVAEGWRLVGDPQNCANHSFRGKQADRTPVPILSKSEDALSYIAPDQTVILDPPRAGCDKKLLDKLLEVLPPAIIYLSCNPATQARDIAILSAKYHIKNAKTFNFFPRTPHIENLVILER